MRDIRFSKEYVHVRTELHYSQVKDGTYPPECSYDTFFNAYICYYKSERYMDTPTSTVLFLDGKAQRVAKELLLSLYLQFSAANRWEYYWGGMAE